MNKLTRKIMTTFFAGMAFLTMSCASGPKIKEGTYLWLYPPTPNGYFGIGYDTDGNGKEDLRKVYQMHHIDPATGLIHATLKYIANDKNSNGQFEEDEFKEIESGQEETIDVQNAGFSNAA